MMVEGCVCVCVCVSHHCKRAFFVLTSVYLSLTVFVHQVCLFAYLCVQSHPSPRLYNASSPTRVYTCMCINQVSPQLSLCHLPLGASCDTLV